MHVLHCTALRNALTLFLTRAAFLPLCLQLLPMCTTRRLATSGDWRGLRDTEESGVGGSFTIRDARAVEAQPQGGTRLPQLNVSAGSQLQPARDGSCCNIPF